MATFGAVGSANPNVLFDPGTALQQATAIQRNRLLIDTAREQQANARVDHEREEIGRASAALLSLPADQRPQAYAAVVADMQGRGLARNAPAEYPGDAQVAMLARAAVPTAKQFDLEAKENALAQQAQFAQARLDMQREAMEARLGIANAGLALRQQAASLRGAGGGGRSGAASAAAGPGGPFQGKGLANQAMNILLTGDPASPEYAAAYAHLGREQIINGATVRPDMSPYRAPTYTPQGAAPAAPAAAEAAPAAAAEVPAPAGGRNFGRAEVTPRPMPPAATVSAGDRTKLRTIQTEAEGLLSALDAFKEKRAGAGVGERALSLAAPTALNSAYSNAALLAKGDALYQLGVLNGQDLNIIRRSLADPSTIGGAVASQATVNDQIDQIKSLINQRVSAAQRNFGGEGQATPAPSENRAAPQRLRFNPATGRIE